MSNKSQTSGQHTDAWNDFWARNAQGGAGGPSDGGGCLPQRWAEIEEAQKAAWRGFVGQLGDEAKLLDLATGDARVLRWIKEMCGDLELTGTDLAPTLPPSPDGITVKAGVAMESLPFKDASFDAVVSQFGFEYGDVTKIAEQIGRVLRDQGHIGLMTHRGDGPILEHNQVRRAEINWALDEARVMASTAEILARTNNVQEVIDHVAVIVAKAETEFGTASPAWEITEAVRRSVIMGARSGKASVVATMQAIEEQARNEVGRISSLEGACTTADARDEIIAAFEQHQIKLTKVEAICEPSGRAFADFLTFAR